MSNLEGLNLEPGRLVGGYTLIEPLGGGAMGSVWRARDDGGRDYAMKILRESLSEDDQGEPGSPEARDRASARERLRREALALKRINHPGVCQIVDMELDDALAFIVTELIEGRNLRDDVAVNGRYIGDDLERLARKLIDAVQAVHQAGIVHRDIKPTNVMISASGPVLVDFGIAMGQGESHVTRTGLVMGTPGFIAPEIIDGAESDQMTDWWSTAAVLAFAGTGRPVFGSKPMMAVLEREASGNADLSSLPINTMKAFRSALSPNRESRCTPQDLLDAISEDAANPQAWPSTTSQTPANPSSNQFKGQPETPPQQVEDRPGGTMLPFGAGSSRDEPNQDDPTQIVEPATLPLTPGGEQDLTCAGAPTLTNPRLSWSLPGRQDSEETTLLAGEEAAPTQAFPRETWDEDEHQPAMEEDGQDTIYQGPPLPAATPLLPDSSNNWLGDPAPRPRPVALIRQARYLHAGPLVLVMLGFLPAILTPLSPVSALALAGILMWFLGTMGLGIQTQINRELKRGGERRGSDRLLNLLGLPWHLLKTLLLGIPRLLGLILIVLAVGLLNTSLNGLSTVTGYVNLGTHLLQFPLPTGAPVSLIGLSMGLALLLGWLLLMLLIGNKNKSTSWIHTVRLGAGWIPLGQLNQESDSSLHPTETNPPQGGGTGHPRKIRRMVILLLVWILISAVILIMLVMHPFMDWSPVPILHS